MTIKLGKIDTKIAEQNFVKMINSDDNKTIFLNGKWGSGKTQFINNIGENTNNNLTFNTLDLWVRKDNRSVIEQAYEQLHRLTYWLVRAFALFLIFIFVTVSVLSPYKVFQLSSKNMVNYSILFVIVFVSLYQFLKIESDSVYIWLFRHWPKNINKFLIIDDFDRASRANQEEAYKLFNVLHGKYKIIFVGEFNEISNSDKAGYLSKIIDIKVDLPYILNSNNIWMEFSNSFYTATGQKFNSNVVNVLIDEERTLRDREQYTELLNRELFVNKKLDRTQVDQIVAIDYLYLFKPTEYEKLRKGHRRSIEWDNIKADKNIVEILRKEENGFPSSFWDTPHRYLINEGVSALSSDDAQEILKDDNLIEKALSAEYSNPDLMKYILLNWGNDTIKERKPKLISIVLQLIKQSHRTSLVEDIVQLLDKEILPYMTYLSEQSDINYSIYDVPSELHGLSKDAALKIRYNRWWSVLNAAGYSLSEKLYFLISFHIFNYFTLGQRSNEWLSTNMDIASERYPETIILSRLSARGNFFNTKEWDQFDWDNINSLSMESFISFWEALDYLSRSTEDDGKIIIRKEILDRSGDSLKTKNQASNVIHIIQTKLEENNQNFEIK
ncbi:P-loop NTPase fold protein [Weissella cibaria]|uniref:Putative P-loop ATPase n=1 Tax=Weissella cibaria TaxID=137591 RepID=A0A0D1LM75_9LACO|nr:P-loop NTPase fold protein [Weissella cibaria]KIU19802.1 putative P-loop ATPase [Weissella cibaria]MDV8929053.1 P-loop NTPase fold protein [Weissella cibaria]